MSAYLQQEYDFINRTRKILEQYEDYFKGKDQSEKYEITLLLNCFVGLLILPQQHWFNNLPDDIINKNEWGINPECIKIIEKNEKTIRQIARHLRNSVSHYHFTAFNNEKNEINKIQFIDFNNRKTTFNAIIPVTDLSLFLRKFTTEMIKLIAQHN